MPQFSFFLASSHHINMNLCYIFLLLLVVLSAYSESPQYGKHSDSFDLPLAAVCPNSSSDNLGNLAPVLPQNESGSVLSQNMVLPQNGVFEIVLSQIETDKTVLHQSNIVTVNCQWHENCFEFYVEYWG